MAPVMVFPMKIAQQWASRERGVSRTPHATAKILLLLPEVVHLTRRFSDSRKEAGKKENNNIAVSTDDKPWSSLGFWSTLWLDQSKSFLLHVNFWNLNLIHFESWLMSSHHHSWPPCAASLLVFSSLMAACWACLIFFPAKLSQAWTCPKGPWSFTSWGELPGPVTG